MDDVKEALKGNMPAILLLGHGSRLAEANDTLRKVAGTLESTGRFGAVIPAFLQMERPTVGEAVDEAVRRGFRDITVMPYFLYAGAHVTSDIPSEIEAAKARHPHINVRITRHLGYHDRLIDMVVERIEEKTGGLHASEAAPAPFEPHPPHPIEAESFRIIGEELDEGSFPPEILPVVKRVIHTTADFEFKDLLSFSPGSMEAGIRAIIGGRNVVTDVRMAEAGISKERLSAFGGKVYCNSSDVDVASVAASANITKAAASMRKAAPFMEGGIVAIGNAPTALRELLRLVKEGKAKPALVIGVPVGFVGAVEAKEALVNSGLEYISTRGRKGGSTVAVAITNAIIIEASKAFSGGVYKRVT